MTTKLHVVFLQVVQTPSAVLSPAQGSRDSFEPFNLPTVLQSDLGSR